MRTKQLRRTGRQAHQPSSLRTGEYEIDKQLGCRPSQQPFATYEKRRLSMATRGQKSQQYQHAIDY